MSDRDRLFLSKFWKELFHTDGMKLHINSAYHPKTNGQTEVVNRCLKTYLQVVVGEIPTQWVKCLLWMDGGIIHASTHLLAYSRSKSFMDDHTISFELYYRITHA